MLRKNRVRDDELASGRLVGEYDQTGALIQEIVWLNDVPVASIRTDQSGGAVGVFYIHTDHLNAPSKITRPSDNAVIWRWDHDPYGNGVPNQDPDGNGLQLAMNLRFPGQYADQETGLFYNYFRDYDPATGRYVQSDPIGLDGGINTYAYVESDPINDVDPFGLKRGGGAATAEKYSGKYCGSGWSFSLVPESFRFGAANFSQACKNHDTCYGTCGKNKAECDAKLKSDMMAACSSKLGPGSRMTGACYLQAHRYFQAVDTFGGEAYQKAQSKCTNCK